MLLFLILVVHPVSSCFSQSYGAQRNQIFAFNILSNGMMAGIGGVIHKKPGEKLLPVFFKNFGRGCVGGAIKYTAKYQTYYFRTEQFNGLLPLNRGLFFLGHSITMNASRNEKMLSNYYANFYGINFHYKHSSQRGERLDCRLSIGTTLSVIALIADNNTLDIFKTLEFGQFYFDKSDSARIPPPVSRGYAGFNSFAIKKQNGFSLASIIPHEMLHTYQVYDYYPLSTYYENSLNKALEKNKTYTKLSKYIDFDYQPVMYGLLYRIQPKPTYYRNYFEFEAEHFGTRRYVLRN